MELNRNNECNNSTTDNDSNWESIAENSQTLEIPDEDTQIAFLADDDDDGDDNWKTAGDDSDTKLEGLGLEEVEVKECAYL